jgi:hypothetical protein
VTNLKSRFEFESDKFPTRKGLHVYNIATQHNTEKNSKDVKELFIAACMSSLAVQSCVWLLGRKGRGR